MNCPSLQCAFGALTLIFMANPLHASPPTSPVVLDWAGPNLFDTVALRVAKTPYDAKWRKAFAGGRGPHAPLGQHRLAADKFGDLSIVQRDINQRISYRIDAPQPGAADDWASAAKTLSRGAGDCEDYAIAKAQALSAHGFRAQDLYLFIGKARDLNSDHAILVVRVGGKFWVLDNRSSDVIDADQFRNFDPIITLSADRKWLHGYAKGTTQRLANIARMKSHRTPVNALSTVMIAQSTLREQVRRSMKFAPRPSLSRKIGLRTRFIR